MTMNDSIEAKPSHNCFICGLPGKPIHQNLEDVLFDAPGIWNIRRCISEDCRLLWLDPKPLKEETSKAYKSYYTHHDHIAQKTLLRVASEHVRKAYWHRKYGYANADKKPGMRNAIGLLAYLHPGWRARLDFLVFYLKSLPEGRLLEIGCGSGEKLKIMSDLGWQVEGVDFDKNAVKNARQKGLSVHLGELKEHGYPSDTFDIIAMSHVIEHVHDPAELLSECRRILKSDGRLIIITPNAESLGTRYFKSDCLSLDPPRHLQIFSVRALENLIDKTGLSKKFASTTIRGADIVYAASKEIRNTGSYKPGTNQSMGRRLEAKLAQMLSLGLLKIRPDVGEDILFIAEKSFDRVKT